MILDYKVKEQTIYEVPRESVARRGSRKYLRLRFQFDDEWQELTKTLYLQHETFSEPIIVEDGEIVDVPDYFATQEYFMITIVGINGDQAVPTNIITISLDPSGEAWETSPPDTDFPAYQQLVQLAQQAVASATTYTPKVSPDGVLSWENDRNRPNPDPVSLKGPRGAQIIPALADNMPEYGDTDGISQFDLPEGCNVAAGDTIIGRNGMLATVTSVTDEGMVLVVGIGTNLTGAPGIGLPAVTAADNGKIPIVANGQWTLEQTIDAAGVMV